MMDILTFNLGGRRDGVRLKLSLIENFQLPMLAEREGYLIVFFYSILVFVWAYIIK